MKLYIWALAPNPRRAKIYVAEKGIDIEVIDAGNPDTPALADWYVDRFPHRRVPILELDDGDWIGEAPAICRYLEAQFPDPPLLMGRDSKEIALVEMWDRIAEWEGLIAVSEVFRNTHKAFVGRGLAGYDRDIPQIPELAERGSFRLGLFYDKLNEQLADKEFVVGDAFTLADITALCAIDFAIFRKLPIPESCPNVIRWHEAVSARPSTK